MSNHYGKIHNRFREALVTGKASARRLSPGGLGKLSELGWPTIMRTALEVDRVHPDAQMAFLNTWIKVGGGLTIRPGVADDDLYFAGLRKLLPPYVNDCELVLFRGQRQDDPIGASWTRSHNIALKFAFFGMGNVDAHNLGAARQRPRDNAVILSAVARDEIICAPCLLGFPEGEHIVDPRNLEIEAKPIRWDPEL